MHSTGKQGQNEAPCSKLQGILAKPNKHDHGDKDDNHHKDDHADDGTGSEAEPNNMSSNRGLKRERHNPGEVD